MLWDWLNGEDKSGTVIEDGLTYVDLIWVDWGEKRETEYELDMSWLGDKKAEKEDDNC